MQSREIIAKLALIPHPEGGWYRECYRSGALVRGPQGQRSALTSIYYLLEGQQKSRWHSVAADEAWHFYSGAPLELFSYDDPSSRQLTRRVLCSLEAGGEPLAVVPAGIWQAARCLGEYALVGCTVGPGFEYADFRLIAVQPDYLQHFSGANGPLPELL